MILEQNFQKPAILSGGGGASTQSSSLSFSLATSLTASSSHGANLGRFCSHLLYLLRFPEYRTSAIISRGLYIFYPISKDHFIVFKEVFPENSVLMYGLYSRAASNEERLQIKSGLGWLLYGK